MAGEVMTGVLGPSERVNLNDPRFVMSGDAPLGTSALTVGIFTFYRLAYFRFTEGVLFFPFFGS